MTDKDEDHSIFQDYDLFRPTFSTALRCTSPLVFFLWVRLRSSKTHPASLEDFIQLFSTYAEDQFQHLLHYKISHQLNISFLPLLRFRPAIYYLFEMWEWSLEDASFSREANLLYHILVNFFIVTKCIMPVYRN